MPHCRGRVVTVDYGRHLVIVRARAGFRYHGRGERLPLVVRHNHASSASD